MVSQCTFCVCVSVWVCECVLFHSAIQRRIPEREEEREEREERRWSMHCRVRRLLGLEQRTLTQTLTHEKADGMKSHKHRRLAHRTDRHWSYNCWIFYTIKARRQRSSNVTSRLHSAPMLESPLLLWRWTDILRRLLLNSDQARNGTKFVRFWLILMENGLKKRHFDI